jgi:hypothetical protein
MCIFAVTCGSLLTEDLMTVFISYARANVTAAGQLHDDVERCHREVWLDQELTGGQAWWHAILQHIRECDVFVVALSTDWVQSIACDLELRYAIALARPVLPVMVAKIDPRLAPKAIVDAQIVNYLQRSPETTFALRDALDLLPSAPPLPSPLPPEPAPPISYLHDIIVMLNAPSLDPQDQYSLWESLRAVLDDADDDERPELLKLVRRLRKRRDLVPQLCPAIDGALSGPASPQDAPGERTWPPTNPQPYPPRQESSPTTQLPRPTRPAQPPPSRARRRLMWISAATVAFLAPLAIWIGASFANQEDPGVVTPSPSPTEPTSSEVTTPHTPRTSTRSQHVTMPGIVGLTTNAAQQQLAGLGWHGSFKPKTVLVDRKDQDGLILKQAPNPGVKMTGTAPVNVEVGVLKKTSSSPITTTTTAPPTR